jgi:capsular polysaccharide biosynthesis protein
MEELDLKELLGIFWAKRAQIILLIAIFLVIGFIYSYVFLTPEYQSVTSILLAKSNTTTSDGTTPAMTTSEITMNQQLVSTYSALVTSESVINQVISNLKIDKTVADLENNIKVTAQDDTEIIQIAVVDEDPEMARKIASEVANVFINKIAKEYYSMDNVYVVDEAKASEEPYNINHIKDLIIFAGIGFVISCVYVLIANMLDTTVKSKEDIEKKLGLTVLTEMPIYESSVKKAKGGRR